MKVKSPVGDFPFEAEHLGLENGDLVVTGSMGAWPARVEIGVEDVPRLARLLPWPVLTGLMLAGLVMLRGLLPRRRGGRQG